MGIAQISQAACAVERFRELFPNTAIVIWMHHQDEIRPESSGSNDGGNLEAAIDASAAADPSLSHLIMIQAGATFQGPFTGAPHALA